MKNGSPKLNSKKAHLAHTSLIGTQNIYSGPAHIHKPSHSRTSQNNNGLLRRE
jgi:hypothetical protein